jgi:hypothetical protein
MVVLPHYAFQQTPSMTRCRRSQPVHYWRLAVLPNLHTADAGKLCAQAVLSTYVPHWLQMSSITDAHHAQA